MSSSSDREFSGWVADRGPALERYAFVLSGDRQRAEDLVQNTLLRVYRHWGRVSRMEHPDAYVRRMVTNEYLDWRRRRLNTETPDQVEIDRPLPDLALGVVDRDEFARALQGITPHQRAVLVLRHVEGLDDDAIASVLGCSLVTVRSHATRGRDRLRILLAHSSGPVGRKSE